MHWENGVAETNGHHEEIEMNGVEDQNEDTPSALNVNGDSHVGSGLPLTLPDHFLTEPGCDSYADLP